MKNKTLARLVAQDQADRENFTKDPERVTRNDQKRREKVKKLLADEKVEVDEDHFNAALILHHSTEVEDNRRAQKLAFTALEMGLDKARWLYAAAVDRVLVTEGKKQKYGTQYRTEVHATTSGEYRNVIKLQPYDKRTSDATRARYNVPPLEDLLKDEKRLTQEVYHAP